MVCSFALLWPGIEFYPLCLDMPHPWPRAGHPGWGRTAWLPSAATRLFYLTRWFPRGSTLHMLSPPTPVALGSCDSLEGS
jgi:hypothetical protein